MVTVAPDVTAAVVATERVRTTPLIADTSVLAPVVAEIATPSPTSIPDVEATVIVVVPDEPLAAVVVVKVD